MLGLLQQVQVQAAGKQVGGDHGENRLHVNRRGGGSQRLLTGIWFFFPLASAERSRGKATRPERAAAGHTMGFFSFFYFFSSPSLLLSLSALSAEANARGTRCSRKQGTIILRSTEAVFAYATGPDTTSVEETAPQRTVEIHLGRDAAVFISSTIPTLFSWCACV